MKSPNLTPLATQDWDAAKARHLLNRAGFGIPRERIGFLTSVGPRKAVDALIEYESLPARFPNPEDWVSPRHEADFRKSVSGVSREERQRLRQRFNGEEYGRVQRLKEWWMARMLLSPRPLEEKLNLFWHGHFAVSVQKTRSSWAAYDLNRAMREHAAGNFKTLTTRVGESKAMLHYLDGHRNKKGSPNENWARELMELFTMGQGNYTEQDIKESARAFTGWNFNDRGFQYRRADHDFGRKTFLGRTGNLDGWDIIDIIFEQPATAEFICRKLWVYFAASEPDPAIIRELAETLRGNSYDLKPLLRQMFLSKAFYAPEVMGVQIKSPVQLVVQMAHDLRLENPPHGAMSRAAARLGQNLFYPPNVKGWDGGRAWINANTLLWRYNLPKTLIVAGLLRDETGGQDAMNAMDPEMTSMTMAEDYQPETIADMNRAYIQGILQQLPVTARRDLRTRLNDARGQLARFDVVHQYLLEQDLKTLWDPQPVFADLQFTTANECVDELARVLLNHPLNTDQRGILLTALGAENSGDLPLTLSDLDRGAMLAAIHLIMSMAEYQLC